MASYGDFVLKIYCFQTSEMCPVAICGLLVSLFCVGLRPPDLNGAYLQILLHWSI